MAGPDFDFERAFGRGSGPAPEGIHPYAWGRVLEGHQVVGLFGADQLGVLVALSEPGAAAAYAAGTVVFDATDDLRGPDPYLRLSFLAGAELPAPLRLTFSLTQQTQRQLWYQVGSQDELPVSYVDVIEAMVLGRRRMEVAPLRERIAATLCQAERSA